MSNDVVEARFPSSGRYCTLLVPPWVRDPTVMPRRDKVNEILVKVSRCFRQEQWQIMPLGSLPGCLLAFRLLGGGGETYGNAKDVRLVVYVPPGLFSEFEVRRLRERK